METTRDEWIKVISLRDNAGWSWSQIGQELNIDHRTCQKIYKRAKEKGTPSNQIRTGRPPIFNEAEITRRVAFVTQDSTMRRLSWQAVVIEMGYACSYQTVKAVMEKLGYHKRVPRRKFSVSVRYRAGRGGFCAPRPRRYMGAG
ncbi:hypothetical protein HOY82DRAFT_610167 [Tuber indicum]|nr:hypothetical protein HOY82DRAFT_610167 [Tuber indicum]